MKKCFLVLPLLLLLIVPAFMFAQIPNPSFETWIPATQFSAATPEGWYPNNIATFAVPVTPTTTAHSGSLALQGSVVSYFGFSYPASLQSWFPYTERPAALSGYYYFSPASGDTFLISTWLYNNNVSELVTFGTFGSGATAAGWTKFTINLDSNYLNVNAPDTAWIYVLIGPGEGGDSAHIGSTFLLDDLAFEGTATAVGEGRTTPAAFALHQNYPNPFNPSTTIKFELPQASHVRLAVYNLLGQELAVLLNEEQQAGVYEHRFDAAGLPSGTYFYRIQAGNFSQVRKMSVVK